MRLDQLSNRRLLRCPVVILTYVSKKLDGIVPLLPKHLFVACLARENGLIDVAVVEATLALHVL